MRAWLILALVSLLMPLPPCGGAEGGPAPARPPGTLRRTVLEWRVGQPSTILPQAEDALPADPVFLGMERQFLDGKISAREFTRFILEYRQPTNRPPLGAAASVAATNAVSSPPDPLVDNASADPAAWLLPTNELRPDAVPSTDLADLEAKMAELIRLRRERQKLLQTNEVQVDVMDPKSKLSKRQRLDLLLKLYIENKISAADYEEKRTRIISRP